MNALADLHSKILDARPPRGSKFFQFHAVFGKFWQNRMLAPPGELAPPPRGNPGSATMNVQHRGPNWSNSKSIGYTKRLLLSTIRDQSVTHLVFIYPGPLQDRLDSISFQMSIWKRKLEELGENKRRFHTQWFFLDWYLSSCPEHIKPLDLSKNLTYLHKIEVLFCCDYYFSAILVK